MKKITFILAATLLLFIAACTNSNKQENNANEVVSEVQNSETAMSYTYIGAEGKPLSVTYDTSGETPTATISYEDYKNVVLTQIPQSAWAKGAEYENETMKWVSATNGGVLTIDGKEIAFEEVK
ncbi:MAG: hypothetical protein Q4G48_09090 [Bacteroidia bacterium]|nr:hypothetical protein [Bacteroidia bacterium]